MMMVMQGHFTEILFERFWDCAHVAAPLSQPIEHKGSVKFWILSTKENVQDICQEKKCLKRKTNPTAP